MQSRGVVPISLPPIRFTTFVPSETAGRPNPTSLISSHTDHSSSNTDSPFSFHHQHSPDIPTQQAHQFRCREVWRIFREKDWPSDVDLALESAFDCQPDENDRIGAAWRIDLASREIKGCTIDQCSSSSTESAIIFDNIAQGTLTITNTNIGGILTKNTIDICIAEGGNGGGVWAHNDEAIRLENVEFGEEDIEPNWSSGSRDKQQHSSSLVFLANHNAGGPTYASGETITVKYTGFVNCVTISGHNKRGVVEMTSKRRVLSSDSDDPSTLTFQELTIDTDLGHQKKKQQDQPLSSQQEPMMDVVVKYDDFLSLLNPKPSNCKYSQPDDSVFPSKQNSDNLAQVLDCPFPHQGRVRWQENEDGRKTSSQGGQNSQGVSFKLNFAKATKAHDMSRAYLQQAYLLLLDKAI
ncbi:hypothetical protein BLNAU_9305 [Blattamonas nauphoetae]|uniref:Uncharacterized protein n=1 Tax=Blattamonas nauphoetae TaxID=2049346 RepID=A0ABQ9XWA0_9EUKA|nr:hypothetical protein BLNAU_9305 [Blattamonas nauphoetae]